MVDGRGYCSRDPGLHAHLPPMTEEVTCFEGGKVVTGLTKEKRAELRERMLCRQVDGSPASLTPTTALSLLDALDAAEARLSPLEVAERIDPADIPQLEACAELVLRIQLEGPTDSNRNRLALLANWVAVRNAERAKARR